VGDAGKQVDDRPVVLERVRLEPGMVLRMSFLASKLVDSVTVPVRKPLPSGL
jgi:hypothetical protein